MDQVIKKSCVAVDPSVNNCGLTVFIDNELITAELLHPSKENVDAHYSVRARDMCFKVRAIYRKIKDLDPKTRLIVEIPEHHGVSAYQSRETGSLYKLTFVCGMIYGIADDAIGYQPSGWKGQLSKEIVRNRLTRDYPDKNIENLDHNIVDSIGIGHKYIYGRV